MPALPEIARSTVVLVVEDDRVTRELYSSALRHDGRYAVVELEEGIDALHYLDTHDPPAAVVLDLGPPLPHHSDVLYEMADRRLTPRTAVIIVTSKLPAGLNTYQFARVLRKPIDPGQLITAVRRCLERKSR